MKILDPDVIEVKVSEDCELCSYCHKGNSGLGLGHYGPLFKLQDLTVHYFCLLFSENLYRRSEEDDKGIFGYAYQDIKMDLVQGLEKLCKLCGKNGAAIQCGEKVEKMQQVDTGIGKKRKTKTVARCTSNFHYSCARDAGVRFIFASRFKSFCDSHVSKANKIPVESSWKCPICFGPSQIDILIKTRCCRPNPKRPDERIENIFHMSCLQRSAWTQGMKHFKCPTCRDATFSGFIDQMKSSGIYVPISDVDYLVEEEDEEAKNSELLPQPVVSGQVVKDKHWDFYSIYMRNGVYSSNEILLSSQTPLPKPIFRVFPGENLEWKELTRGGSSFPAPSPTSNNCYSGFLRLQPTQRRRLKDAKTNCFELVLLVYKGTLRMEYSYRGSKFTRLLPPQSVGSIQPGLSYSLENETDRDVVIFYIFKKMGTDSSRNSEEAHCQLIEAKEFIWASPTEFGSPVGIKRCFTGEAHHQGFVKIPPLTCTRFTMNKFGPTVYFVFAGEVVLRSSKFEDDSNSSDEDDEDKDGDRNDQNDVRSRCLASEVYTEGSSFEIPYMCCFVIENWDKSFDPDRPPACLFYDIMDP